MEKSRERPHHCLSWSALSTCSGTLKKPHPTHLISWLDYKEKQLHMTWIILNHSETTVKLHTYKQSSYQLIWPVCSLLSPYIFRDGQFCLPCSSLQHWMHQCVKIQSSPQWQFAGALLKRLHATYLPPSTACWPLPFLVLGWYKYPGLLPC